MVHALEEMHRVLVPAGTLIDLRPLAAGWPVEVVSRRERERAGEITDEQEGLDDDAAANQAMLAAEARRLYEREKERTFPFNYYWDSPEQMKKFVDEEWSGFASLDADTVRRVKSLWAVADADARVRVQLNMLITRWRRLG